MKTVSTPSLLALAVMAIAQGALAADAADSKSDEKLDTVLVTATRTEQQVSETLAPATVFTEDDIERLQVSSVSELLQRIPGSSFNHNGGPGSVSSFMLRGTNDDHTLFLIDGQRISSATLGTSPLEVLDVDQIERIEVVRGPRSSLYGADAIGGVVQIFTKKGGKAGLHPKVSYGVGKGGTQEIFTSINGAQDNVRASIAAKHYTTDGIDNLIDDSGNNADRDAYRNSSLSTALGYAFDNGADIELTHYRSEGENEYDDGWGVNNQPYGKTGIENTTVKWVQPVGDIWRSTVQFGETRNQQEAYDDLNRLTFDKFNTERESASWQNDFCFSTGAIEHVLTAGVDYYDDSVASSQPFADASGQPVTSRDNLGTFIQEQMELGRHELVLGLREDDNEEYNRNATGNISYGYAFSDDLRAVAAWGTAFKAPTFNDMYWPASPWSAGNPDLKPEESENVEIGLKGTTAFGSWAINVFENNVDQLIEWAEVPKGSWFYTPTNVDKAEIQGVEFELATRVYEWDIAFNASYIDARYDGKGTDHNNVLLYRPKQNLFLDVSRRFGSVEFGTELVAQSDRYTDRANTDSEGGYGLVNLRSAWHITDEFQLQVRVNNLFDKEYRLNRQYETEGFGYMLTAIYTPSL